MSGVSSLDRPMRFVGLEPRVWPAPVKFILWAGLVVTIAIIVYFGVISASPLPDHRLIVNWNDVVLHAGAFLALTLVALALFAPAVRVCVVVFALGVGVEIVQLASAHHEPSLRDVLANGAGVVLAGLGVAGLAWACRGAAWIRSRSPATRSAGWRETGQP